MALFLAVALTPLATALAAPNPGTPQTPNTQQNHVQAKVRTYYGTIVKLRNGQYALMISFKTHRGYHLDDQKDVKKFDKEKVLVTGIVNPQTHMLQVKSIKRAAH